ncbi:MAG: HD domain-containing protein [Candidatus Margulisiibacteriota bacterium]|nr:HD domain-containing protein [Candidatus Margulisiibacteriota bacterium]
MKIHCYSRSVNRALALRGKTRLLRRHGIAFPASGVIDRGIIETREQIMLSPYAALSSQSRGQARLATEGLAGIGSVFERDRSKILSSLFFRRLSGKAQILIAPSQEHVTTRLFHTTSVTQIARAIGRTLGLNEDLIEAIALGHDLGHTPFGHAGERALDKISMKNLKTNFRHNRLSQFIADEILHLSFEAQDGILRHSGKLQLVNAPSKNAGTGLTDEKINATTLEGVVVKIADKLASAAQDLADLKSAAIFSVNLMQRDDGNENPTHRTLLQPITNIFGENIGNWYKILINDVIENSKGKRALCFSKPVFEGLQNLMALNKGIIIGEYKGISFDGVSSEDAKVGAIVDALHRHYTRKYLDGTLSPGNYYFREKWQIAMTAEELDKTYDQAAIHRIAGMTDRMAIEEYLKLPGSDPKQVPKSPL